MHRKKNVPALYVENTVISLEFQISVNINMIQFKFFFYLLSINKIPEKLI